MLAVPAKSAKIKDCHPKCLGKYRSRPRCNVKRLFAPNSHLAKLKTRDVANIKHLQNVDARRRRSRHRRFMRKRGSRAQKGDSLQGGAQVFQGRLGPTYVYLNYLERFLVYSYICGTGSLQRAATLWCQR